MPVFNKWISVADVDDRRTKFVVSSITYSQNKNGAWQKENIFCRIFANHK